MTTSLSTLLAYESPGVLADVGARYCLRPPQIQVLFEQVLRWVWLLDRHQQDMRLLGELSMLLERPLAFIGVVGERFLVRTREYAELCERSFGRFVHWPAPRTTDARTATDDVQRAMELVYDELGADVFSLWFDELAERYRPEHFEALRLCPSHKSFCELDAAHGALGLAAGSPPDPLEVVCAVSGRAVEPARVTLALHEPRIVVVQGALTPEERTYLVERARDHTRPSHVRLRERDASRTSESWRPRTDDPVVMAIQRRLASIAGIPADHAEPLQVNRYPVGTEFKPHYDNPSRELLEREGLAHVRLVSIIAYLDDVREGGETWFPYLGVRVSPVAGTVLVFHNFARDGREDADKKHAGLRVRGGEKWIATQWLWSAAYTQIRSSGSSVRGADATA